MIQFVSALTRARDLVDVNIAAGLARERIERAKTIALISLIALLALAGGWAYHMTIMFNEAQDQRNQITTMLTDLHSKYYLGSKGARQRSAN